MTPTFEAILYYLILADAIFANITVWSTFGTELTKRYGIFAKYFPITRGWTTYYLVLVLWLGWALARLGVIW